MIDVTIYWDRQTGTFWSTVEGADPAEVAVRLVDEDDGRVVYGNNAADPDDDES